MEIRKLPSSFCSKGFHHELVQRKATAAIYRRSRNAIAHFEVIRIRVGKLHPLDENRDRVDAVEIYPRSAEWGTYGWTFRAFDSANSAAHASVSDAAFL